MFKNGTRVRVIKRKSIPGIGWVPEMDRAIGEAGVILSEWDHDGVEAYLVKLDNEVKLDHGMNYTFPAECLEEENKNPAKGDQVIIGEKPKDYDQRVFWMEDMDEQVGLDGVVVRVDEKLNVALIDCSDDDEELDQFWFPFESITIKKRAAPNIKGVKWYLGEFTHLPYKLIKSDEDGSRVLEDSDGEFTSSKYMRLIEAPMECDSFDWRMK